MNLQNRYYTIYWYLIFVVIYWIISYYRKEVVCINNFLYKPGEDNKPAGDYIEVGPRGGQVNDPRIVSIDPGDRLPPTSEPKHKWKKIN